VRPLRLFVAVLLNEATRVSLAATIERLRTEAPRVAWVRTENLHLTLKFLGTVADPLVEPVREALGAAAARAGPFDLTLEGLGAFPGHSRPRVIWAGVAAGHEAATALAGLVDAALAPLGFPPEGREFSPHVTLGRVREPRRDEALSRLVSASKTTRFGSVRVRAITLMRSELSPRGAHYTEMAAMPLAEEFGLP
jgi:RNA 2',3'-cyclic 3'-phosphodiesterase